ncbi:zona pellucida sperm-binding protein 3-like [Antennarius striatus]|uniref:zona pellucida sperm-binding protein 3-like n=1 Tax=Antennarius striatus TaxID=241820 RepID=UPI0035B32F87
MGRDRAGASCGWILVLISLSSYTKCRLVYGQKDSHTPSRTGGSIRPEESARPRPIVVHCHPDSMEVVVQADMFDRGLRVDGAHLRLGSEPVGDGSPCRAISSGGAEFRIQANLMDCGTELSSTKEKIIYSNVLVYSPEPSSDGLLRLDGAVTPVVCHYQTRYSVNGISVHPTWDPYVFVASAEGQIDFNLQLMTDNWNFKRGSYSYFLGDPVLLELSAVIRNHTPLRVYVDRCTAMATPDAEAPMKYNFILNHGCFADAFLTNSSSHFLPRMEEHKLRFQLDAFRFYQEPSNKVHISCLVKAVPLMLPVCPQNRACSLIENRWQSIDGNDPACGNCDLSHLNDKRLSSEALTSMSNSRALHSVPLPETLSQIGPASYYHFHPRVHQNQHGRIGRTTRLGLITILPANKTDTRQADSMTAPNNRTS